MILFFIVVYFSLSSMIQLKLNLLFIKALYKIKIPFLITEMGWIFSESRECSLKKIFVLRQGIYTYYIPLYYAQVSGHVRQNAMSRNATDTI